MKPLIRAIIMSMTLLSCQDKRIKNVLFVGNSLTYYNEMPKTLQSIIDDQDVRMNVQQITFPGYFLSQHLKDSLTISRINSQDWDYVVLQEATVRVLIPEIREYNFYPAVHKLDSIIKIKNGTTVLYQSYAISIYPKQYCMQRLNPVLCAAALCIGAKYAV